MDTTPVIVKKTLGLSKSSSKHSLTPCRRVGLGRPSSGSLKKLGLMSVRTVINTPPHTCSYSRQSNPSTNYFSSNAENESNLTLAKNLTPLTVSLKQSVEQNNKDFTRVRRCLTQDVKQNIKKTEQENEMGTDSTQTEQSLCSHIKVTNDKNKPELKKLNISSPNTTDKDNNIPGIKKCQTLSVYKSTLTEVDVHMSEQDGEINEDIIVQLMSTILEKKKKLDNLKVQEIYSNKHKLEELRAQSDRWREVGQEALRHCVGLATRAGYPVTILELMKQHQFPLDLMGYNADDDEFE